MSDHFTILHALSKNNMDELKAIAKEYSADEDINPKEGKPKLIDDLLPYIPQGEQEKIIDRTFNKPKNRYTAHVGIIKKSIPVEDEVFSNCEEFNRASDYDKSIPEYQTKYKQTINLVKYNDEEVLFYYTLFTKKPEYDFDVMESKTVVYSDKVRVIVKPAKNTITVFTGNKDLFNSALTALTLVFGFAVTPLNANKVGISNMVRGSFSAHTVKFLDFIYHGLSKIGTIGDITHIDLETTNKSKNPQKVNVRGGNDLLDDKSICEYLFIHARDLVGVRLNLLIDLKDEYFNTNIEIGVRDNRIKIGVKKENHSISRIKSFYEVIERIVYDELKRPALIDELKTVELLDRIKSKSLN